MAVVFTVQLHTYHYISTMFAYFQLVGSNGVPHPFRPVFLLGFHCALAIICLRSFLIRISEITCLLVGIVQTESGT